jgi:hypothetical protein
LRDARRSIADVELHDLGTEQCAIVSFSMHGRDAVLTKQALTERGINISASSPYSTRLDARPSSLARAAARITALLQHGKRVGSFYRRACVDTQHMNRTHVACAAQCPQPGRSSMNGGAADMGERRRAD